MDIGQCNIMNTILNDAKISSLGNKEP